MGTGKVAYQKTRQVIKLGLLYIKRFTVHPTVLVSNMRK
jgi:hypothetical protein